MKPLAAVPGRSTPVIPSSPGEMPDPVTGLSPAIPVIKVPDRGKDGSLSAVTAARNTEVSSFPAAIPNASSPAHGTCGIPETVTELRRILPSTWVSKAADPHLTGKSRLATGEKRVHSPRPARPGGPHIAISHVTQDSKSRHHRPR